MFRIGSMKPQSLEITEILKVHDMINVYFYDSLIMIPLDLCFSDPFSFFHSDFVL